MESARRGKDYRGVALTEEFVRSTSERGLYDVEIRGSGGGEFSENKVNVGT